LSKVIIPDYTTNYFFEECSSILNKKDTATNFPESLLRNNSLGEHTLPFFSSK
jgi:hypothetical protein